MTSDTDGDDPHRKVHVLFMPTSRGEIIRQARVHKRISQDRLGQLTGVSRSAVSQWESNATEPDSSARLQRIAEVLDIDLEILVRAGGAPKGQNRPATGTISRSQISHVIPPLVVWRALPSAKSRPGGFVILHEKEGEVARPIHLIHQTKAFAFKVIDEANAPVYRARDHLIADPDTAAIPGDDCLFADGIEKAEGSLAFVGNYARATPTLWIITQYGREGEIELPKVEFPHAWPIVGRYHRR